MTQYPARLAESTTRLRHARWLALAATLVGGGLFLLWWFDPRQLTLPLCAFHHVTGLHCPGCGATRATHELLHGRLAAALHDNALWALTLPLMVYAAASEMHNLLRGRPLVGDPIRRPWMLIGLGAAAVVFGVLRNVPYYPFSMLAPLG